MGKTRTVSDPARTSPGYSGGRLPGAVPGHLFGLDLAPDERADLIGYLRSMQNREQQFPGFAGVIEGAEMIDGTYHVLCLKP